MVKGCLKEEDITCKVRKQEYEENEGEGEMSETKEEDDKIVISVYEEHQYCDSVHR